MNSSVMNVAFTVRILPEFKQELDAWIAETLRRAEVGEPLLTNSEIRERYPLFPQLIIDAQRICLQEINASNRADGDENR